MQSRFPPGIYLIDKPPGPGSTSLVRAFAEEIRAAGVRPDKLPLCHGGALDPFAEGLLLLLAGPATRLMDCLHAIPKTYEATIEWGTETDSGDGFGQPVPVPAANLSTLTFGLNPLVLNPLVLPPAALEAALREQLGWQDQVPPTHSNKRVGGERAYQKAHRGEEVTLPPSRVYLHEARWLDHRSSALPQFPLAQSPLAQSPLPQSSLPQSSLAQSSLPAAGLRSAAAPRSRLQLTCRGGYYVRSLARDLGRALGCGAHLSALRRTAIGPWLCPAAGERTLVAGDRIMPWCPARQLSEREARLVESRQPISRGTLLPPDWPLPPRFPGAEGSLPGVRALFEGRLLALLTEAGDALLPGLLLGRGL